MIRFQQCQTVLFSTRIASTFYLYYTYKKQFCPSFSKIELNLNPLAVSLYFFVIVYIYSINVGFMLLWLLHHCNANALLWAYVDNGCSIYTKKVFEISKLFQQTPSSSNACISGLYLFYTTNMQRWMIFDRCTIVSHPKWGQPF